MECFEGILTNRASNVTSTASLENVLTTKAALSASPDSSLHRQEQEFNIALTAKMRSCIVQSATATTLAAQKLLAWHVKMGSFWMGTDNA